MIDFNKILLPDHSRVWVYQADRKLSPEEQDTILSKGKDFTAIWAAHGNDLMAGLYVFLGHFIIIVLDEQVEAASGCSIDKSMKFILDLQKELGINFTNRMITATWKDNSVQLFTYEEIKNALEKGSVLPSSMIFDNTITSLKDLKSNWLKPLKETWLRKLLDNQKVG